MSSTLNGSSALRCFEHSNVVEIRNGMISTQDCHIYIGSSFFKTTWTTRAIKLAIHRCKTNLKVTLYFGPSLDAQFAVPGHISETATVHFEIFCQKSFLNDVEIKCYNNQLISITVTIWQLYKIRKQA